MSTAEQLDIFTELAAIDHIAATQHLPRTFTTSDQYTAAELNDAFAAWENEHPGIIGSYKASHMWVPEICSPFGTTTPHSVWVMDADLRCDHHRENCHCVGSLIYRAYCSDCNWWTDPTADEGEAIRAYHDRCWPGWRNLPVLPAADKLPDDYPQDWQVPGAPVVTTRQPIGTRNVPGRSPFGGYDMTDPDCL